MERRNIVAAVVLLLGATALIYGVSQADEPWAITGTIGVVLAVGMGVAFAAALLADRKHFSSAPHQGWFVVMFVVLLGVAASSFASGMGSIAVAALLAIATLIVLLARTRHPSNGERPRSAS